MIRLPNKILHQIHRFLPEIHGCADLNTRRHVISKRLARLIPSDRSSFNELDTGPGARAIVPAPVPAWWPRFGELYQRQMLDHPLWYWIREGKRNAEIAIILGISPRTVGKHVEHVLEKLGAETRTAAVRAARHAGL